ncbi:MAG: KUP/HAK/KT family potassium transporter [Methanospirillum sp.]|nr:KUP/HAK/KT family potassium transporter [Methanospirillum sp.]
MATSGRARILGAVKASGLVFGDIGTSPIYTLTVILGLIPRTEFAVLGALSLIIWTLILIVTVQYAWLAMSLGKKGEGGTIVLHEILDPLLKTARSKNAVLVLTVIGISLLIGDGVITPAISILSAVEGLRLVPGIGPMNPVLLVLLGAGIATALFLFQRRGSERVASAFGPLMVVWFAVLTVSGLAMIVHVPIVLNAFNPLRGLAFLFSNGLSSFLILASVILCATGGEALYADMGHLGRESIQTAWSYIFVALAVNYLGQGAFALANPGSENILFELILSISEIVYVPFVLLSIAATVIASQAMISGIFSIVYQGIMTRLLPAMKVEYTSTQLRSQIYIDIVNWGIFGSVLLVMFVFRESGNLASAYGLAVTGTMTVTGLLMTLIFMRRHRYGYAAVLAGITLLDVSYFGASLSKLSTGGYWSLVMAAFPLAVILIYIAGQRRVYRAFHPVPLGVFLDQYREVRATMNRISGTALFFARDVQKVPPYVGRTMFVHNILYQDNILVSIVVQDAPFGLTSRFKKNLAEGLRVFEVRHGYLEMVDIVPILHAHNIQEKAIFYGCEEIVTDRIVWRIFATIKRLSPSFVEFYRLPANQMHGVTTRIEM